MTQSTFGARVVGDDEAAKAIAAQKGGAEVFGKRVIGPTNAPTAEQLAKGNSQFGPLVVAGSKGGGLKGTEALSVKDIENVLEENPTFFDSLYEAELARKEGPRTDALKVFLNVEYGIKGAGRQSIIQEIRGMLGLHTITAQQAANDFTVRSKEIEARQERMDENLSLADAERVKALKERDDNLNALKNSKNKGTTNQLGSVDTEVQRRQIAKDEGLDTGANQTGESKPGEPLLPVGVAAVQKGGGEGRGAHADLKDDDVKPETQQKTERKSSKRKSSGKK